MLPATNRLTKKNDIERALKRGRLFFYGDITLKSAKTDLPTSRITVIASLKVSKSAVKRNTLKRKIREIVRTLVLPRMKPGFDCVLLTKAALLEKNHEDLKKTILGVFEKARLISSS